MEELGQACVDAETFGLSAASSSCGSAHQHQPVPTSLEEVLANSEALMVCRSPASAYTVLGRYSPGSREGGGVGSMLADS